MIGVFRIHTSLIEQSHPRHIMLQLGKLLKKWAREIKISAVLRRVPPVPPPAFVAVNFVRLVCRINRHRALAAQVVISAVQSPLVPPSIAPQLPALRAPRGRRDFNLFIKIKILGFYLETTTTIFTYSLFV